MRDYRTETDLGWLRHEIGKLNEEADADQQDLAYYKAALAKVTDELRQFQARAWTAEAEIRDLKALVKSREGDFSALMDVAVELARKPISFTKDLEAAYNEAII